MAISTLQRVELATTHLSSAVYQLDQALRVMRCDDPQRDSIMAAHQEASACREKAASYADSVVTAPGMQGRFGG